MSFLVQSSIQISTFKQVFALKINIALKCKAVCELLQIVNIENYYFGLYILRSIAFKINLKMR